QHVWVTSQKQRLTQEDLKLHSLDILEGAYSLGNIPDVALVQEFVGRHKIFRRFAYRGTPDIRVIVFNKVPVMAMLRLPTKVSGGRANLHQGALGVGIDMATGITTKAIWFGKVITHKPGTNRKLQGIKIPNWTSTLALAVTAQIASGLGYVGIDILYHPEKGQMVLEINAEPGLEIQLANMAGLKKRLERVEDLEVVNSEHGVKIAKALFSSGLVAKARTEEEPITVEVFEEIKIRTNSTKYKVKAKLDTGAWRSSIDKGLAEKLGLLAPDNILWTKKVKSSLGIEERSIINLTFYLKGKKVTTAAGLANRSNLRTSVIIGRRDLAGFLVKPVN
ncbi:MAG: sugar-transfer associated ATP-grasp domain-containing protein, partial [Patescibacteria group bacterium]